MVLKNRIIRNMSSTLSVEERVAITAESNELLTKIANFKKEHKALYQQLGKESKLKQDFNFLNKEYKWVLEKFPLFLNAEHFDEASLSDFLATRKNINELMDNIEKQVAQLNQEKTAHAGDKAGVAIPVKNLNSAKVSAPTQPKSVKEGIRIIQPTPAKYVKATMTQEQKELFSDTSKVMALMHAVTPVSATAKSKRFQWSFLERVVAFFCKGSNSKSSLNNAGLADPRAKIAGKIAQEVVLRKVVPQTASVFNSTVKPSPVGRCSNITPNRNH